MKLLFVFVVLFCCSCSTTHVWDGQKITKNQYEKKLKRYTIKYIKNTPKDVLMDIQNLQVNYNTSQK